MRKILPSILLLLGLFGRANAAETNALVVSLGTGGEVVYLLDSKPVLSFSGAELTVTCQSERLTLKLSDVRRFSITKREATGISPVASSSVPSSFSVKGDLLSVCGLPVGAAVRIYSLGGQLLSSGVADGDGNVSLRLPAQGKALVVKTPVSNFKILKP